MKLWGILNGDYWLFLLHSYLAGEFEMPTSLKNYSKAESIRLKYGYQKPRKKKAQEG